MRYVLLIAASLLLVALGLERELPQPVVPAPVVEDVQRDVQVSILATGWRQPLAEYGQRKVFRGFFVGSHEYRSEDGNIGLAALELRPDGSVSDVRLFNLRYELADGLYFSQFLDELEVGSVLLLGSCTSIGKAGDQYELYNEKVRGLYRRVDAKSDPTVVSIQSFALASVKREDGTFKALAETYSETKGVRLSYMIPADRSELLDVEPTRLFDARTVRSLELTDATAEGFEPAGMRNFHERIYDCFKAKAGGGSSAKLTWALNEGTEAPAAPETTTLFTAKVAMPWSGNAKVIGVRYTLWVDGVMVGDFPIWNEQGSASQWLTWEQRIPASFGAFAELEVQADVLSLEEPWIEVLFTDPVLTSGSTRGL